jgi:hypothetical protein
MSQAESRTMTEEETSTWIGRGGWRRRAGSGGTDGRKIKIPAFYRRHEAALAQPMLPQSEQVWVGLPLTTGIYGQAQRGRRLPGWCGRRAKPFSAARGPAYRRGARTPRKPAIRNCSLLPTMSRRSCGRAANCGRHGASVSRPPIVDADSRGWDRGVCVLAR